MAKHTAEQYQEMAKVYASGVVLVDLASQFNVSVPTMSKWVVKGGGVIRPRGQRPKVEVEVEETPATVFSEPVTRTILALG